MLILPHRLRPCLSPSRNDTRLLALVLLRCPKSITYSLVISSPSGLVFPSCLPLLAFPPPPLLFYPRLSSLLLPLLLLLLLPPSPLLMASLHHSQGPSFYLMFQ